MFIEPPEAPDIGPQSTDGDIVELAQAATVGAESIGQITVLQGIVEELYDVVVLNGVRRPMALGFKTDEINRMITIGEPETL